MADRQAAEALARQFHETYERLAPEFGYETRRDSAVPWEDVPEQNKRLMVAVAAEVGDAVLNLIEAAQRIADTGCHVRYSGYPDGFTCLDRQADAANPESRYMPEFRERVLAPDYPCLACQAKAAVAVFVSGQEEP